MLDRRQMLIASGASLALSPLLRGWVSAESAPRRKILMFTKSAGFEHSVVKRNGQPLAHAERILTELGKEHGFDVTCTKDGGVFDSDLSPYDAFFFYTTGDLTNGNSGDKQPPMSKAGKQRFLDAIAAGKGFLGSHCASDTFHLGERYETQAEPDPYIAMLGGEFIAHQAQQPATMRVVDPKFPSAAGLGNDFSLTEEWYSLKNFAKDLHVVLVNDTQGMTGELYQRPPFPATWAHRHGKGRVFYTSMGHREDVWTNPKFQQLLLGGIAWAVGNVEAELTPNLAEVTPGAGVIPPQPPPRKPAPAKPAKKPA